jgi:hypothetical protein
MRRVKFDLKIWFGRSSGHSNYYTVVGSFDSNEKAEKAGDVLREALRNESMWNGISIDWDRTSDPSVEVEANDVRFMVYTAGYLEEVYKIIKNQNPREMREFEDAQELEIVFKFNYPEVELDEIKILLLLKHPDLKPMIDESEASIERTGDGKTLCTFEYFGDWIFDSDDSKLLGHPEEELGCTVSVLGE